MRIANDIQPDPVEVPRSLHVKWTHAVTLFYALFILLLGFTVYASARRYKLEGVQAELGVKFAQANGELARLTAETAALDHQTAVSGELAEWLTLTPPAQALTLLLTQDVEPNVAFSRLLIDMVQGQPNMKLTVEMTTVSQDSASRQVASIQAALDRAGFHTVNIDTDQPTPDGWRFVAIIALPAKGDFSMLTIQTPR